MATNRRDALRGAFALLGVAFGIGATSKRLTAAQEQPLDSKQEEPQGKQMVLHARHLRISSQDLRRGELPPAGVRMLARAEITFDAATNEKQGEFFATYYRVNTPGKAAAHELGSLEQHTFILPEGSIFGSGATLSNLESEGQFAIIGGTGRYHGARGSYVAQQDHIDFGGNGTAKFIFTLI